jgi:hypothetical protein
MKAKKIPKKRAKKKTTAATRGARKNDTRKKNRTRKKKAAPTPVGDLMRSAAEVVQSVANTIRP